jgi:hypothetical protein
MSLFEKLVLIFHQAQKSIDENKRYNLLYAMCSFSSTTYVVSCTMVNFHLPSGIIHLQHYIVHLAIIYPRSCYIHACMKLTSSPKSSSHAHKLTPPPPT